MQSMTLLFVPILLGSIAAGRSAQAAFYSAAADFSPTNNSNGVWSFGQFNSLGAPFILHGANGTSSYGFDYWSASPGFSLPGVLHNATASSIHYGTAIYNPGQLVLHPGASNEYSVVRFTAPVTGLYSFQASFIGADFVGPTTSNAVLLHNGVSLFGANVIGYQTVVSSGMMLMSLTAGDTLDAAVGFGPNGTYYGDSTGLDFTVESVPSPGADCLLGLALVCTGSRRRRDA
ncbi:MAG: hypothetical protein U0573_09665 [Phycisphaerales bacterium]|nr:hypothetical protein [Planctomycetota bacterium]